MSVAGIFRDYWLAFASGLHTTMMLCMIVWLISFLFGTALGVLAWRDGMARMLVSAGTALISGVPAIVVLFWAYYPGQALLGIDVAPFPTACVALSIIGVFLVAHAIHRILADFPSQYWMAAKVTGMDPATTLSRIVFPIVLRDFIPVALIIVVNIFHMSFFAAFISVDELFRATQRVNSVVYQPVAIYSAFAGFCLLVSLPLYGLAEWLRRHSKTSLWER